MREEKRGEETRQEVKRREGRGGEKREPINFRSAAADWMPFVLLHALRVHVRAFSTVWRSKGSTCMPKHHVNSLFQPTTQERESPALACCLTMFDDVMLRAAVVTSTAIMRTTSSHLAAAERLSVAICCSSPAIAVLAAAAMAGFCVTTRYETSEAVVVRVFLRSCATFLQLEVRGFLCPMVVGGWWASGGRVVASRGLFASLLVRPRRRAM